MDKKLLLYILPILVVGTFFAAGGLDKVYSPLLKAQPPVVPPGGGPPGGVGNFAPVDASYVVTQSDTSLTNEVITTQLTTDLIPVSSSEDVGSSAIPWGNVFGLFGKFTEIISNKLSSVGSLLLASGGTNQNIFLDPSGKGKVKVGGDSLVVASLPTDPSSAENGQIYYNTTFNRFRIFENGSFRDIDGLPVPTPVPGPSFIQAIAGEDISANDLVYISAEGEVAVDFNYNLDNSVQSNNTNIIRTQEFITTSPVEVKSVSFWIQRMAGLNGGTLRFKVLDQLDNTLSSVVVSSFTAVGNINGQWVTGHFSPAVFLAGNGLFKVAVEYQANTPNQLNVGTEDNSVHPGGNLIFSILGEINTTNSGKAYRVSARNSDSIHRMVGFALNTTTAGGAVTIIPLSSGQKISGFSGLSPGKEIYPSNTRGLIANTSGWIESSIGYAVSATEIITRQPRRAYSFSWKSPFNQGGTFTSFGNHRFLLPLAPRRIVINSTFSDGAGKSGLSNGMIANGAQHVGSIGRSTLGFIDGSSASGKIIQWRSESNTDFVTASIAAVDNIGFTLNFSGSINAGANYIFNVEAEE